MVFIKKIFLNNLPRKHSISTNKNKLAIDWYSSIGYKVKFIYNDLEDWIEIIDYTKENSKVTIKYKNKKLEIFSSDLKKCGIGNIIGAKSSNYFYTIGDIVNGIKIINQTRNKLKNNKTERAYNYECPICGNIDIRSEGNLKAGQGCGCCNGNKTVIKGINDIATTAPWMVEWLVDKNDAYKYKSQSHSKILFKCIYCGCEKLRKIDHFYSKKLGCCNDGISYPNKFIFNLLQQLNIKFKTEYNSKWTKSKRYDFYFTVNNTSYIIEANGNQHYEKSFSTIKKGKTLEEEQENDRIKKELAIKNGIKEENYIVIDCRKSELEWIRDNENGILNSRLNELFDLSKIDWLKTEEFACSNRVKEACDYWETGKFKTAIELSEYMNISSTTANDYLAKGVKLNWCSYNSKESMKNTYKKVGEMLRLKQSKAIKCIETGHTFKSITECAEKSLETFGVKLSISKISLVCNGKILNTKGFSFVFI